MIMKIDFNVGDLCYVSGLNWLYRIESVVLTSDGRYCLCKALFPSVPACDSPIWVYDSFLSLTM